MNRQILGLLAALALAAGCDITKSTTYQGPIAQCRTAGGACTQNAECCSYGCDAGVCVRGTHEGTVCKTTNDCGTPDFSVTQMLCKSGHCAVPVPYCRDDSDICAVAGDCCSHHCDTSVPGGACIPNKVPAIQVTGAVQTVPRNQPWPMAQSATASDPDPGETATLSYGWTFVPAVTLSPSNTVANPTFNPGSAIADYQVSLTVTDVWGATATAAFTLHVVNTPPVVTPALASTTWDRNNGTLNVAMSAYDENNDSLSCAWTVCRAGTTTCLTAPTAPPSFQALKASPKALLAPFPTGLAGTDEGPWDVTLSCSDGSLTAAATTTVTVTNSPPAVALPATRTYNLDYVAASTPQKTITATATDSNTDPIASWQWTVVSAPAAITLANDTTATVGFTPTVPGVYTLRATACDAPAHNAPYVDRAGACGYADVVATVHRYIRPITASPGTVVDAAWRKVAGNERLVAVGTDSGSANQLWIVNPGVDPGTTADAAVGIGATPVALSLSGDGLTALVGETAGHWQTVAVGTTPAAGTLQTAPLTLSSVVHFGSSSGYALGTGGTSPIYNLNLSTGAATAMTCKNFPCTIAGTKAAGNGTTLWALDTSGTKTIRAYSELGNQLNQDLQQSAPSAAATNVWRASDPAYLYLDGSGGVVFTGSLSSAGSLPAGATHADSSLTGGSLVGLAATSSTVTPFGSGFTAGTPIALPHWGTGGADRAVTSKFVFVSADGTKAHVVVQASGTADLGLYTCTLPCPLF